MYDQRLPYSDKISEEAKQHFNSLMFNTVIPRNTHLSEACTLHRPVDLYNIRSTGANAYLSLARELLKRHKKGSTE